MMNRRELNLIINLNDFETKSFLDTTIPEFAKTSENLVLSAKKDAYYSAGMFFTSFDISKDVGKRLTSQIKVKWTGKGTMPMAMILFFGEDGTKIQSSYFVKGEEIFTFDEEVPTGAVKCEINLFGFFFGDNKVEFSDLKLEIGEKKAHRVINVATAFIGINGSPESNMQEVYDILDKAGNADEKPDIICFTEGVHCLQAGGKREFLNDNSIEIKNVCERAKKYSMYVLFTSLEEDEKGMQYNTAFVITPDGKIFDRYRKTHLTLSEFKTGLVPGDAIKVFDLPIGKFGILICWDQWFTQASKEIEKQGAEMLFWLTRGYHEERQVTRARDTGMYIITSHPVPANCRIAHPTTGEFIARGEGTSGYAMAKIDLDERQISEYKSFGVNGGNDKDIFINELRNDLYTY